MDFGLKILMLRKQREMSQKTLADKLGIARSAVHRWEIGQEIPDTESLQRLCNIFDIPVDFFLNSAEEFSRHQEKEKGCDVSRVMLKEYLAHDKCCNMLVSLWFSTTAATSIPYLCADNWPPLMIRFTGTLIVLDIVLLFAIFLIDHRDYEVIEKEKLFIAPDVLQEISRRYKVVGSRMKALSIVGGVSVCGGTISLLLIHYCIADRRYSSQLKMLCTIAIALGINSIVYSQLIPIAYVSILGKINYDKN